MLDVILDCFGVLLLFGQAALFLVNGQIEALPDQQLISGDGDGCLTWP